MSALSIFNRTGKDTEEEKEINSAISISHFVVSRQLGLVVPAVWVLHSIFGIFDRFDSWVHDMVEYWWANCESKNHDVLEGKGWSSVEPSENLIRSEFVGMMV